MLESKKDQLNQTLLLGGNVEEKKEQVKLYFFTDYMIVYLENLNRKQTPNKTNYCEVSGYKYKEANTFV